MILNAYEDTFGSNKVFKDYFVEIPVEMIEELSGISSFECVNHSCSFKGYYNTEKTNVFVPLSSDIYINELQEFANAYKKEFNEELGFKLIFEQDIMNEIGEKFNHKCHSDADTIYIRKNPEIQEDKCHFYN